MHQINMFFLRGIPTTQHQNIRKLICNSSISSTLYLPLETNKKSAVQLKNNLNRPKFQTIIPKYGNSTIIRTLSSNTNKIPYDDGNIVNNFKRRPLMSHASTLSSPSPNRPPVTKSLRNNRNNNSMQNAHDTNTSDSAIAARVSVKSIYAARTIDINAIVPKLFYKIENNNNDDTTNKIITEEISSLFNEKITSNDNNNVSSSSILPSPTTYRHMGKVSVILKYPPEENGNGVERYAIVFRFGSVVFINMKPIHADAILKEIKAFR